MIFTAGAIFASAPAFATPPFDPETQAIIKSKLQRIPTEHLEHALTDPIDPKLPRREQAFYYLDRAVAYSLGLGVPTDLEKSFYNLTQSAERGSEIAIITLGHAYLHGDGVPQNFEQARHWFSRSNVPDAAETQYYIALSYHYDHGNPLAINNTLLWAEKAASKGLSIAHELLGKAYSLQGETPQTLEKILYHYRQAAEADLPHSQFQLSTRLYLGEGTERDREASYFWACVAAASPQQSMAIVKTAQKWTARLETEMPAVRTEQIKQDALNYAAKFRLQKFQ